MKNSEGRTHQINFSVSERELKQIKQNAAACEQSLSAYIRESALNMCVIPFDLDIVTKNSEEIAAYRNVIAQLTYTIKRVQNFVPADLEYILEKTKALHKSRRKFEKMYIQHMNSNIKNVEKTVKKTVEERLKKT